VDDKPHPALIPKRLLDENQMGSRPFTHASSSGIINGISII